MNVVLKRKTIILLLALVICFLASCSAESEPLRPIDYPDTKWSCSDIQFTFTVSGAAEITDAGVINSDGNIVDVTIVFSEIEDGTFSVNSIDGKTVYFSGTCVYEKDKFTMTLTDIYDGAFSNLPIKLHFSKV